MARGDSGSGRSGKKSNSPGSKKTGSRSSGGSTRSNRSSKSNSRNGRSSSSSKRSNGDLPDFSVIDPHEIDEAVDVYVDAPVVKVDEIKFEMDDLRAHLAVLAEAGHFVQINAGASVRLGKVELDIQGVETQAVLEARLHNVTAILGRVLTTLDRNPELLQSVGEALGDVGGGAHDLLTDTGDVVKSAGKGAESAVQDVGRGAGKGVAGIGRGAEQGVEGLGQGAGQGVEDLGQGAGQGVQGLGQGAGQGVQGLGQGAGQGVEGLGQGAGQGVQDVGQGAQQGVQNLGGVGQQGSGASPSGG
jgi:hypothetical protein